MNTDQVKIDVCEAGTKLIENNLVAGSWGNISVKIDENTMIITPSGKGYDNATPEDMVEVNIHTLEYSHRLKPSSEMKLHAQIYKERKKAGAVIHTHSMNASTVAAARREVPPILDDMAQIIGPSIRVAKYALPGTKKIVKETVKALKGRNGALMANHGAIVFGGTLDEAFTAAKVLEKACKAFIEAEFLGGAKSINKFEARLMHEFYLRKYSKQEK